jgi:radical SAM protein with 4Fe4S-binding SPASM domain
MMKAILTGGECLTYPGFEELFIFLHSLGCEVSILTNGFLLDDNRIRFFQEHMPACIRITLYGWNDDVYEHVTGRRAFTTVCQNVQKIKDAGLPLQISVTPSTFLGEDALETIKVAESLCQNVLVNSCIFTPREETGRSGHHDDAETDLYVQIYRLLNDLRGRENKQISEDQLPEVGGPSHECAECGLRCGGGRSAFVVDWKGALLPCNRLHMISRNVLDRGFIEAWKYINYESNRWPRVPECDGCAYENVCNNCAATVLQYGEPGKRPIELCKRTKHLVKNGVWHIPDCE